MSYDQRCYDLAELFLSDEPDLDTEPNRKQLAQLIQTTIEDEIKFGLRRPTPRVMGRDGQ